jgi:hypothetical protein
MSTETSTRLIQYAGDMRMTLVAVTSDSVTIEAAWSASTDPSGVASYDWRNWRTTVDTIVAEGLTSLLADTFSVEKPPVNSRWEYGFEIRATDGKGNVGPYSMPFRYAIVHEDRVGPSPPDTVYLDTLIIVASAQAIAVWPPMIEIEVGERVQFYAAVLYSDGSMRCDDPPPASGVLYESGTFIGGCDSAMARLR